MADPRVLVVLLNYRTAEMTARAADTAVRAMTGMAAEMVIVDNDSRDGSFEALSAHVDQRRWAHVRVLQSGHNGGYGAGNNFGMRAGLSDGSAPEYYYLLNSDAFPEERAIALLRDYLEANRAVGFAGSHIFGEDGETHITAFRFPSALGELEGAARTGPITRLLGRYRVPLDEMPKAPGPVDWLAGASLMMRRSALEAVGLFDETFFLYFEETDLCRRAAKAGWPTHYVPESRVMHIGSGSTGMKTWARIPQFWLDSRTHYFAKNHGWLGAVIATKAHVLGGLIWRLRRVLTGKAQADPDHFLRDLITHDMRVLWPWAGKPARITTLTPIGRDT
ncbi:glycosyltransferase family 2 protein [Roseobacteraceae bacterium S113]